MQWSSRDTLLVWAIRVGADLFILAFYMYVYIYTNIAQSVSGHSVTAMKHC